jgi:hypothetical protein
MTDPPAARPTPTDPGGLQARADGQKVEVRTHEGELIRIVDSFVGGDLVRAGLADNLKHCVRLKLGIRWLPPRLDRPHVLSPGESSVITQNRPYVIT